MSVELLANIWFGVKILAILGLSVYALFAAIMVRQEQLMSNVLDEDDEPVLRFLTVAHFIASLVIVFLAFILL